MELLFKFVDFMRGEHSTTFYTLISGALGALAVVLASVIASVINASSASSRDRKLAERRVNQLDHATKRAAFWDLWLKAVGPIGTQEELEEWKVLAKRHLLAASSEMDLAVNAHDLRLKEHSLKIEAARKNRERMKSTTPWRLSLFFYRTEKPFGYVLRAALYLQIVASVIAFSGTAINYMAEAIGYHWSIAHISVKALGPSESFEERQRSIESKHLTDQKHVTDGFEKLALLDLVVLACLWISTGVYDIAEPTYSFDEK